MSIDDESPLHSFLSERLPQLGLDYETYGPYVSGQADTGEDDDDDNEELDGVLELLQSSSETHSDDDGAWAKFREDLMKEMLDIHLGAEKRKEEDLQRARDAEVEKAKQARLEAQLHQEELDRAAAEGPQVDEEKQRRIDALVLQYGYECPSDDDGGDAGGKNDTAEGSDAPQSNKEAAEVAKKAHIQKVRDESSKVTEGKQAAREATAKQKMEKNQKKEDRKKRAQKGERRR